MRSSESPSDEVSLLSTAEAVAEVRRWLEVEGVDPEAIFSASAESTLRYKDLIAHLEGETPDGRLIRFAISRGRSMQAGRRPRREPLVQILPPPAADPPPGS